MLYLDFLLLCTVQALAAVFILLDFMVLSSGVPEGRGRIQRSQFKALPLIVCWGVAVGTLLPTSYQKRTNTLLTYASWNGLHNNC